MADEIIAPDYVRHDAGDPFPVRGPDDVKRIVKMLRMMLPDLRIEVDMQVAGGNLVVHRYTSKATDTVGYLGMPTGRSIRTPAIQIFRIVDGKIVESWAVRTMHEPCANSASFRDRRQDRRVRDRVSARQTK